MTIEEQTGWKRPNDVMILQDIKLLSKVTKFDFDLTDIAFREYCTGRLGYNFKPDKMTVEEYITLLQSGTDMDIADTIKQDKDFDKELEFNMKILQLIRAKIQDCWEIYNNTEVF